MRMASPRSRSERGFAILIVLWTLVLVALIMTHMIAAAREQTQLASNLRAEAAVGAVADGAVYDAIFHVLDKSAAHWPADGSWRRESSNSVSINVRVQSEAGKVNLNTARVDLLSALLNETGVPSELAKQIATNVIVWRSPAAQVPAMADTYRAAGYGYAPPNAPFESVSEFGDVLDVTPQILARVSPFLTVYSDGDTDPASASPTVLRALHDLNGNVTLVSAPTRNESVIEVSVNVSQGLTRAEREAIVRVSASQGGTLYEILDWKDGPGRAPS